MFRKLLIANRGEIACRVIRTARRMGVATVAVYSDADAEALHVALADEARPIGPPPARDSYLNIPAIIAAARASGAAAVHPGYGFLAENDEFAEACGEAGLVFVGPPPSAIRAMGDKAAARALMEKTGVPVVPGYHGDAQDDAALAAAARRIGFPVLLKPSAGGGGKGMRVVEEDSALEAALAGARREALAAFGDDRLVIERYVLRPRHVEVQVFADAHDHCLYLSTRDCSIQRRHQKVIEEAPAPGLDPALSRRMGEAAVAAARSVGYRGAGTVEFLLAPDGQFYFMEMNTRLQVEHPVTEMVTGLDLVEWQLRVAAGEALPLAQEDVATDGHAIEARLYAEDPDRDFLPAAGRLDHLRFPAEGNGLRIDSGVREGDRVSIHYDPMIAKVIAWGTDREEARQRLHAALKATEVTGPATNRRFLAALVGHPAFAAGELDTGFIARHQDLLAPRERAIPDAVLALACLTVLLRRAEAARVAAAASSDPWSPWARTDGWRLNDVGHDLLEFAEDDRTYGVPVLYRPGGYELQLPGGTVRASGHLGDRLAAILDGVHVAAGIATRGSEIVLFHEGIDYRLRLVEVLASSDELAPTGHLGAPMPGKLTALMVGIGDRVAKGQPLAVLEAMKMEHTLVAPGDGSVASLPYAVGDLVDEGAEVILLTLDEAT